MFIDKTKVDITAGKGGLGFATFGLNHKPSGGDGGKGGDVYLVGDENMFDLTFFNREKHFKAGNGFVGGRERSKGADGADLLLKVPLKTVVLNADGSEIAAISKHQEKVLIAKGGIGGLGNHYFKSGREATLYKTTPGRQGEKLHVFLELQLMADVVFIGLPNAGKSSMLNQLTHANAKVASYAFTTLHPNLGRLGKILLADLPGLIEGTVSGKGLGTRFTKHAKHSRLVAHFVALDGEDIANDYKLIRKEIEEIDPDLYSKPELLILTKTDNLSQADIAAKVKIMKKFNPEIVLTSVLDEDSIESLKQKIQSYFV